MMGSYLNTFIFHANNYVDLMMIKIILILSEPSTPLLDISDKVEAVDGVPRINMLVHWKVSVVLCNIV